MLVPLILIAVFSVCGGMAAGVRFFKIFLLVAVVFFILLKITCLLRVCACAFLFIPVCNAHTIIAQ